MNFICLKLESKAKVTIGQAQSFHLKHQKRKRRRRNATRNWKEFFALNAEAIMKFQLKFLITKRSTRSLLHSSDRFHCGANWTVCVCRMIGAYSIYKSDLVNLPYSPLTPRSSFCNREKKNKNCAFPLAMKSSRQRMCDTCADSCASWEKRVCPFGDSHAANFNGISSIFWIASESLHFVQIHFFARFPALAACTSTHTHTLTLHISNMRRVPVTMATIYFIHFVLSSFT